ncbi:MAG: hypothetical protein IT183_02050 [Acidobacteria bacterium]|nr:hypothetical protein [Acidobacteriota bacterium]
MRVATRFVTLIILLAVGFAVSPRALLARSAPAAPVPPTEADMVGTWTGTVLLDQSPDPLDGGIITINRVEDRLAVTVGPNPRVRYSCVRLVRTERGLKFEVSLPNHDETRLLAYDVAFADGAMTGTVTFVRHGLTAPARLTFTRQ